MDSAPLPAPQVPHAVPQEVLDHIRLVIAQTRILISVTCGVYLWEWITNLSAEYTFIWKSRMGPLNIVFLILRYYTFLALGILAWVAFWEGDDMKQCGHMVYLLPYMPLVLFALANIIVIARVYAMWDADKRILALLSCLYLTQIAVQAYVPRNLKPLQLPPGIKACGPAFLDNAYLLYWIMVIVFDTTVLALSLVKLVALWRSNGRMSNLVRTLFRDQIIFYILTFTVNVVNITVYYVDRAGGVGKDFIAPVAAGITSMAICRVVLNLRREAVKQPTFVSSSRSRREGKASNQHLLSGAINVPGFPASELSSITANRVGQATPKYQSEILRDIEKQEKCDGLAGNWDEAHDVELDRVSK